MSSDRITNNILMSSSKFDREEEYWKDKLQGDICLESFSAAFRHTTANTYSKAVLHLAIPEKVCERLLYISNNSLHAVYILLLSGVVFLSGKFNGYRDNVIGIPVFEQDAKRALINNVLPLRIKPDSNLTYKGFLALLKEVVNDAIKHQNIPYGRLVELLGQENAYGVLFETVVLMRNIHDERLTKEIKADIIFDYSVNGKAIELDVEYNSSIFTGNAVESITGYLLAFFDTIISNPDIKLIDIDVLNRRDKEKQLNDFNDTAANYPHKKTIHEVFEEQVIKTPDNIAVKFENDSITYNELNRRANQLSNRLRKSGVTAGSIIAIIMDRSIEMIIGMLGILKSGGAYLPIDPDYPEKRILSIIKDSAASIIVTMEAIGQNLPDDCGCRLVCIESIDLEDTENTPCISSDKDLAYIIYTSGSTGNPKGVMVEHRNVIRLMINDKMRFDFDQEDIWTMFHSFCFDFSVWEMYGALLYGGTLIVIPKKIAQDPAEFLKVLKYEKVTVLNQTPTAFYNLASEELKGEQGELYIRYIIFGGEVLKPSALKAWKERYPESKLINMYGITETTVHVTYKEITDFEIEFNICNVGKPIPTLTAYIMDEGMKFLPAGAIGELFVGGDGVARGYLNKPGVTAERFMQNPYKMDERLYRSGDLARFLPDGELEYIGRADQQVKIRGHRIELGEIETLLLQYKSVNEAVVLAREDESGNRYICTYLLSQEVLSTSDIREYLSSYLPAYMIPAYFIQLERLPLTSNGKIDIKALAQLERGLVNANPPVPPSDETEEALIRIWGEVLKVENIGIKNSFFDLGGDSIKAIKLISSINLAFYTRLQIKDIYLYPDIKQLAEYLRSQHDIKEDWQKHNEKIASIERDIAVKMGQIRDLPESVEDIYPMSDIEIGMVYYYLKYPKETIYYEQIPYQLNDMTFDYTAMKKALEYLTAKHQILRTTFNIKDYEVPVNLVHRSINTDIELIGFPGHNKKEQGKYINNYLLEERRNAFDVSKQLWKLRLFELDEGRYCLVLIFHHAILDGWSVASLITELINLYNEFKHRDVAFTPLRLSYRDFVLDQMLAKNNAEVVGFWKEELKDYKRLAFHNGHELNRTEDNDVGNFKFKLDEELLEKLKVVAKEYHINMKSLCFAAYTLMLSMHSYENEFVVGMVEHCRPQYEDGDKVLGCFLNTVPVKVDLSSKTTWKEYILKTDRKLTELKAYGVLPLAEISRNLNCKSLYDNPLFDALFNYVDFHVYEQIENGAISEVDEELGVNGYIKTNTLFDFTLNNTYSGLSIDLYYSQPAFTEGDVYKLLKYFENVLRAFADNIHGTMSKTAVMSADERKLLLYGLNDTKTSYPREKTVCELFDEQARLSPEEVAVVYKDNVLTYRQLESKANQVARLLRERNIGRESVVGIMMKRSHEAIIGVLGILKAGGVYLPIDPDYPHDRIRFMLEDSNAVLILTNQSALSRTSYGVDIINIDKELENMDGSNPGVINEPDDMAYIIYTSGSTGKPKGTMVEHRSIVRLVKNTNYITFETGDRILQTGDIVFDASTFEVWGALLNGLSLYLADNEVLLNPDRLGEELAQHKITTMWLTSPLFNRISQQNPTIFRGLKNLLVGGDVLSPKHINRVREACENICIINGYGPTENTTFSVCYKIDRNFEMNIPIGKPISNSTAYILDKNNDLLSFGAIGEICVGGDGVARGYLNRPELTVERFVPNPFVTGDRLYKTGDLARWNRDGSIEFLGRMDSQVKIRGFRVELDEIQAVLNGHEALSDSVVVDIEDINRSKYLCAYYVTDNKLDSGELRRYLTERLPEYMVPAHFVPIERLPLNINGKIDRNALPNPVDFELHDKYVPPQNETEERLVSMFIEALGHQKISVKDNIFEIGVHSLNATMLASKIHKAFGVKMPLKVFFQKNDIREIAEYIRVCDTDRYEYIAPVEEKEYYAASSSQKRLFVLSQFKEDDTSYNIPVFIAVEGELEQKRICDVFQTLIRRHESLRTSFDIVDGDIVQFVHKKVDFNIELFEVAIEDTDKAIQKFIKPFNLKDAPLIRVGLLKYGADKYIIMIDIHHIVSDGVSLAVLYKEFLSLYKGDTLPELEIQYKDFSEYQNRYFKTQAIKDQEGYWTDVFSGKPPVLNMPTDFPRQFVQSFEGDSFNIRVSKELTGLLKGLAKNTGTTLYMVLLAAYSVLLSKYTGQEDIVVGTPVAGRKYDNLENVIGMFVNMLAIRSKPQSHKTFMKLLDEVREYALKAYENQDYQFEELVKKLEIERDLSRNPLFDTACSVQSFNMSETKVEKTIFKPYDYNYKKAKFDLTLTAAEYDEEIELNLNYCTKLFKKKTIERLGKHFINVLKQLTENPDKKLYEISLATDEEKDILLGQFNNTSGEYEKNKTYIQLFEEQVKRTPHNTAIVFEDRKFTYKELNARTNSLARLLREKGVKTGSIVGIMSRASIEMAAGIIGILKAGGAYLPIDPGYPAERINYMLEDSGANILLAQRHTVDKVRFQGIFIDIEDEEIFEGNDSDVEVINNQEDLAYVIYTSGSTGKPKGVMVENRSLINLCFWHNNYHGVTEIDRASKYAGVGFDASVLELFPYLIKGASVFIISEDTKLDIYELNNYLEENNITISFLPTSICEQFIKLENNSLRLLLTGGEKLRRYIKRNYRLVDNYGPTENTVVSTCFEVDGDFINIPIGKPISNTRIYILDKYNALVPVGVVGELCISGDGLARGYLNRPRLTAERFVPNPVVQGERMYKTGDLARWLDDGNIEFWGRTDNQVKIRGHRIELGEIESQILEHELVKEAVVIGRKDNNQNSYLCAYIVPKGEFTGDKLKEYLSEYLPKYMVPLHVVELEKMPLTQNGKIDVSLLPEPNVLNAGAEDIQPEDELEKLLQEIWKEILGVDSIGLHDNFFGLGGDSIKAIQISTHLGNQQLKLNIRDLFDFPTIKELKQHIKPVCRKIDQGIVTGEVQLTPVQKWFFEKEFTDMHHFNQSFMLYRRDGFDETAVNCVFNRIIEHHDALRMVYRKEGNKIVQFNRGLSEVSLELKVFDFIGEADYIKRIEDVSNQLQTGMELENGRLIIIGLFKTSQGDYLLVAIHHLVVDGISWRILLEDFSEGYLKAIKGETVEFQEKTDSFAVWAAKLKEYSENIEIKTEKEYWGKAVKRKFSGIPRDYTSSENKVSDGVDYQIVIPAEHTEKLLRETNRAYNTDILDILLTALALTINKWSGLETILVNLEGHGREEIIGMGEINVSRTVGWFTAMFPVIFDIHSSADIAVILKSVRETLRRVPNKGIGYGILKYLAESAQDFGIQPEISFNYLGQFRKELKQSEITVSGVSRGTQISPHAERIYALDINAAVDGECLVVSINYNKHQYRRETIKSLCDSYSENLIRIIEHCSRKCAEVAPADFSAKDLDIEDMEDIFRVLEEKLSLDD